MFYENLINNAMLLEFNHQGIEDTPANRLAFLEGVQEAWLEDTSDNPEKVEYQNALNAEINRLKLILSE